MSEKARSLILFARPSALFGAASIIDFGGTLVRYVESNTPRQADTLALWSDWLAVGDDMWHAVQTIDAEHGAKSRWPPTKLEDTEAEPPKATQLPMTL